MNNNEKNTVFMEEDDNGDEDYYFSEDEDSEEGGENTRVEKEGDEEEDDDGEYIDENGDGEDDEDDDYYEDEPDDDDDGSAIDIAQFLNAGVQPARVHQLLALIQAFHGSAGYPVRRRPRTPSPPPEPDRERGNELLNSGEFGRVNSAYVPPRENKRNVAGRLWMRELKPRSVNPLALGESILPSDPGKVVDEYEDSAYSGQYSEDGSLFATCDKDFKLRIYKTAGDKLIRDRVIQGSPGRWTITDHNLSLDNHWLIYSSITPYVYLTRTAADAPKTHHQLDFSTGEGDGGLWSIRFSGDGREIVAGGRGRIYVYDIESRTVIHSVNAHTNDVNAVCFAEPTSSQVLFSGSDDRLVKVWDRRSMGTGANCTPSGVLVGHSEGITYVTSKGDNRYLASNGKDQKMLLWDLRKMYSGQDRKLPRIRDTGFDYRQGYYPGRRSYKVPGDCSVMTFQGHSVLKTLIRCHFSPVHSTGQRYLYTGSSDGKVYIYRLDGTLARTLDTCAAFQRYAKVHDPPSLIARDVSWHPYHPTITSSVGSWYTSHDVEGGIVQHSFTRNDGIESDHSDVSDAELRPAPPLRRRFRFAF
ncbi:MAG: WD40-repeat-containing domain protein [Benniella sp.]|nr:MAG: WD40-repeat-containing domain protein [Benniella sp.]